MGALELRVLIACNVVFLTTIWSLFLSRAIDRFVKYFLVGEYVVAMVPLSAIGILSPQTTLPIILIFWIHISLLLLLCVIPRYFSRKS